MEDSHINEASLQATLGDNEMSEDDSGNNRHTEEPDHSAEAHTDVSMAATTKQRRKLLDSKLKNYKLKRKLPVDSQILSCAQKELQIKRRIVEKMDKMDEKYAENMEKMSNNMEKLTQSISDGLSLLKQAMTSPQYPPPNMYHTSAYNPYMQGLYGSRMPNYQSSSHSSSPSPIHSALYDKHDSYEYEHDNVND